MSISPPSYSSISPPPSYDSIEVEQYSNEKPVGKDAQINYLSGVDCFVLIDRSTSMKWKHSNGEIPWDTVQEYLKHIVNATIEYDKDGVEVAFFGSEVKWMDKNVESAREVTDIFRKYKPNGATNLSDALSQTFKMHFDRKKRDLNQRSLVVVITDGAPSHPNKVIHTLRRAAKNWILINALKPNSKHTEA